MSGLDARSARNEACALSVTRGTGLRIVSHDILDAARLCTRVAVMDEGRIIEDRPSADLLIDPRHPRTRALVAAALPFSDAAGLSAR